MTATEFEFLDELDEESPFYQTESSIWDTEFEFELLPETAVARASERWIDTSQWHVDPLRGHAGSGANLLLRWNNIPLDARIIDIVVHLHGYIGLNPNADTLTALARRSGLDLSGRTRPALAILPRGRRITPAEVRSNQVRLDQISQKTGTKPKRARDDVYTFPALTRDYGKGLEDLVSGALVWLAGELGPSNREPFQLGRMILTAHSGGGAALNTLVAAHTRRRVCNPDEVHMFDGLYAEATGVKNWVSARIAADERRSGAEMRTRGGGLRVFYRSAIGGTRYWSEDLARSFRNRAQQSRPWYRAECTTVDHLKIPNKYGPPLLRDRAADLSFAACASGSATRRQARSAASKRQRFQAESPRNAAPAAARANLPTDVFGWILSTNRSAIELIANPAMRRRFLSEIDWKSEYFRGNLDATGRPAVGRAAEELFAAMARVVPERRVPFTLQYRPDIANIVVPIPDEPGKKLHPEGAAAFVRMRRAAANNGIPIRLLPGPRTAWRSAADQAHIRKGQPNPYAAAAGIGAHMYGLAVDLALGVLGPRFREANTRVSDKMANVVRMYRSPVYKWLALYGNRFGWFPYRREPWHWEYNPPGFKQRFEANRGKSRELEFDEESELELEEDPGEAAETELLESPQGRARRRCADPRIPKVEPVRPLGKVACTQASAHNNPLPLNTLAKARERALEMLNNAVNELVRARSAVCEGATPAWPLVSDATICWLNRGLGVNTDDIRVWTAGSFEPIRSVAEVIRRLIRVRNLIGSSALRYSCASPDCDPEDWAFVRARDQVTGKCLPGTPLMLIRLCRGFWVRGTGVPPEVHAEFQAQTIIHEASHLTHCNDKESGHTIAVPECLAQFVAAVNDSWLDSDFVDRCIGTGRCRVPAGGVEVFQRETSRPGYARRGSNRTRLLGTAFRPRPRNAIRFKDRPALRH
jgi:hypothetical protein